MSEANVLPDVATQCCLYIIAAHTTKFATLAVMFATAFASKGLYHQCGCFAESDPTNQRRAEARLHKDLQKIENISSYHSKSG